MVLQLLPDAGLSEVLALFVRGLLDHDPYGGAFRCGLYQPDQSLRGRQIKTRFEAFYCDGTSAAPWGVPLMFVVVDLRDCVSITVID